MKYRKLRIAWSVAWGLLAVSLCVLWVRSYYVPFRLLRANAARSEAIGVQSNGGQFVVGKFKLPGVAPPDSVVDARLATDRNIVFYNQLLAEEQTKLKDPSHSARDREWIAERQQQIAVLQQAIAQWRAKVAMAMAGPQSIRPHASSVTVSHWLLLLVTATLAAAPWTKWRFSLRTLLIATTIIAVGLGIIVWMTRAG
jgi:hypothetical protein